MNAALKMPWLDLRLAFNGDPLPEPTPSAIPVAELAPTAGQPNCPKCNRPMTGGAPHGPWPVQWECRPCGVYINADEPPDCPKCRLGRIKGNFGEEDAADQWCSMCGWPHFEATGASLGPLSAPAYSERFIARLLRLKSAERRQQALAATDRETTQTLAGDAMLFENAAVRLEAKR